MPLFIGIAIFWLLYRNLDMKKIWGILQSGINYYWIFLSMVIGLFSHIFRALRWRIQLRTLGTDPSMRTLTNAIFGTYAMNLIFPRLGEVWRCGYVARREKMSFTQALGSVFSDRLCDTLAVVLLTVGIFFLQMPIFRSFLRKFPTIEEAAWHLITSPWLYVGLIVIIIALVWLFCRKTENKYVLKVKSMVNNLWCGFKTVLEMKQKFLFLFYTVMIWFCYFMQLYVCLFAFQATQDLGVLAALTLFIMGSISMGIPVQGGLGPWHLAIIATLSLYGVEENAAGAFALVAHGVQMILIIILGIYTVFSIALEKKSDVSVPLVGKTIDEIPVSN